MPGRVLDQARAWAAPSAAALIEHDDAVVLWIEELPRPFIGAGAGTTVQEDRRVAAFFVINLMDVRDAQVAMSKGLDRRIQLAPRGVACLDRTRRQLCSADRAFLPGRSALEGGPPRCGS